MMLTAALPFVLTCLAAPAPASTAAATLLPAATVQKVADAKVDGSSHRYPVSIKSTLTTENAKKEGAKPEPLSLTGLAVREKYFISVNVYTYALYVDDATLKSDYAMWKGKSLSKIEKDKALFSKLLTQKGTKELRMRFCRDVDADDIVEAFDDMLKPRILKLKAQVKATEAEKLKTLKAFRGFFSLDELKDGNELRFTWHADGTLSTIVNGERKADIVAPELCKALFDVYIGSDPISNSGKKKMVKRLPLVLK